MSDSDKHDEIPLTAGPGSDAPETGERSLQARLAREERGAALRALAGRLAHQIRNPLAAVRAACSSLQSEIDDADQRETLDLTIQEIDRMLGFVSATVQTAPAQTERPQPINLASEIADVVSVVHTGHAGALTVSVIAEDQPVCSLPKDGFRVAVYSMLDHLIGTPGIAGVSVSAGREQGRALVRFDVTGRADEASRLSTGMITATSWSHPVGLLVAERFARDLGGRLVRSEIDDATQTFTLELPCPDA